jgi:glycosyltransferase involved in cell wall biosynthesis
MAFTHRSDSAHRPDGAASDRPVFRDVSCAHPLVDVVVPVYNEEKVLASSIRRLRAYLDDSFPLPAVVTVVDNASTDATASITSELQAELEGVRAIRLENKGRGGAVRAAWLRSEAEIVAYMDVDLSTSLDALLPLVAPLLSGHSSVVIGSRLGRGARVVRSTQREVISRAYNSLLKIALRSRFSDAQCGFKATLSDTARWLLSEVKDDDWFFDTELLVRAQRHGLRISEVPVDWTESSESSVDIASTARDDLKGIVRLFADRSSPPVDSASSTAVETMATAQREMTKPGAARPKAGT